MPDSKHDGADTSLNAADIGALAHLYRAEVYRSTIWRTRLDTTTNWAVVTLGVALSITYSSPSASELPLVLVGVLILLFLSLEARRYRYFSVWRARARWLETNFYVPMLQGDGTPAEQEWQRTLATDYLSPQYHVSYLTAIARRVRNNYLWILLIQSLAYVGKLMVHPIAVPDFATFVERANIGPVQGGVVLATGAVYILTWSGLAIWVEIIDARRIAQRGGTPSMG